MSNSHAAFVDVVERATTHSVITPADRDLLTEYADAEGITVEEHLDSFTRAAVEDLTGREDVWSPRLAASALLAMIDG